MCGGVACTKQFRTAKHGTCKSHSASVPARFDAYRAKRGYNSRVEWWVWLAGGLVLLLIELATPSGFFVMFFGLGAITVGAMQGLGIMDSALLQWLVFTILSVIYLLAFRGRMQKGIDRPPANIDTLVGEIAFPRERIPPGQVGRVDLRGTMWNARNETTLSVEVGQRCRVTRVDGLLVSVQPE